VFIQLLHDGSKEFAQNDVNFSKYVISDENKVSRRYLPPLLGIRNDGSVAFYRTSMSEFSSKLKRVFLNCSEF
jgi:hypothetical protein